MITLHLKPDWAKIAPKTPFATLSRRPLYHQTRTLEALRLYDLVMNSYNTGTGKTVASLLYLFDLHEYNQTYPAEPKNALIIAPTNALINQHATDITHFVVENRLDFQVITVTAAKVRALSKNLRPGEILHRLIKNYLEFEMTATRRQPIIMVVNPDIFYYALFFRYRAHDRRNLFGEFVKRFDYLVVDEFHYYDYKQLANFLFAFALFDQLGYFKIRHRKICLLSATPDEPVRDYLQQLFGSDRWTEVSPLNEPSESDGFETRPTLSPLTLTIIEGRLAAWFSNPTQSEALAQIIINQDGAIISSSLAQINQIYHTLQRTISENRLGRITGPESETARHKATAKPLILATPTVDIGYNFVKKNKTRQNVDFVYFDAWFGDELIQRLGRAGRVLGKPETDQRSQAIALLSPEATQALAEYNGQTLNRTEFAEIVRQCGQLPPKHRLTRYINSYAIMECFWPIYQFEKMLPPTYQAELDTLFARIQQVFAADAFWTKRRLAGFFSKLGKRQLWLQQAKPGNLSFNRDTAQHVADWLAWRQNTPYQERLYPSDLVEYLPDWLEYEEQQQALIDFVESQKVLAEALFSFRDSFQGPTAVFYDEKNFMSSETVNQHDLFHLIRNYQLSPPMSRRHFETHCQPTDYQAEFYVKLLNHQDEPVDLVFSYDSEDDQDEFEHKWCNSPVALKGLQVRLKERQGGIIAGGLTNEMALALAQTPLPMLIVPPESKGPLIKRLRGTTIWSYPLIVSFADGGYEDDYSILLGTNAFVGYAELKGHFLLKDKLKDEPIIV